MIPHADLIGRPYSRGGLGPGGPLSCTGAVLAALGRAGISPPTLEPMGAPGAAASPSEPYRIGATLGAQQAPSCEALAAEDGLARWAAAAGGPWEPMDVAVALAAPRDGDVVLLDADGHPMGLGVVVDAVRRRMLTSLPGRGVVTLALSLMAPRALLVYRWSPQR